MQTLDFHSGSYTIIVAHPGGTDSILRFFTGKAFRLSCQRLLSQSTMYRRTLQTSHLAQFERIDIATRLHSVTKRPDVSEHGAPAPRAAFGGMPPPLVKRGEIEKIGNKVA